MAMLQMRQPQKLRRPESAETAAPGVPPPPKKLKIHFCFLWLDPFLLTDGGVLDLCYEVWQELCW
jgi:hypothetical protein